MTQALYPKDIPDVRPECLSGEAAIAWAAGLFEGEGCLYLHKVRGKTRCKTAQIYQTDLDVLQRFHVIVRVGRLNGPYDRGERKSIWLWAAHRWDDLAYLYEIFSPWLGERRLARFKEVMEGRPVREPRIYGPDCGKPLERSNRGYQAHRNKGEPQCRTCLESKRVYENCRGNAQLERHPFLM